MAHDPNRIQLGTSQSNIKDVDNRVGLVAAGLVARLGADNTISATAGTPIGISLGRDLSNTNRSAVARRGLRVPLRLAEGYTPAVGAAVTFDAAGMGVSGGTATKGVYVTGAIAGVPEDGSADVAVALVDFPGGL